ncbi:hypothetical protein [Nocardioides convexus]|uniref:hypothetical protein n=1 Tax=Nocardioides convexus TaxID=2712224 RepID=UPI00241861F2|nr:hypothetical protein [Nocardioides convexus]
MSRYRRYDGGDPLAPPVDIAEALDAIGEDVMAGYSPERAMREFLRRGGQDQAGLDDLARRVAERRREPAPAAQPRRHAQRGPRVRWRRPCWRSASRLARDAMMDDGDRAFREMRMENLPGSPAAAVTEPRRLRLAVERGPGGVRADQGPARPRVCWTSASQA